MKQGEPGNSTPGFGGRGGGNDDYGRESHSPPAAPAPDTSGDKRDIGPKSRGADPKSPN